MKRVAILFIVMFLFRATAMFAFTPAANPADYTVNIHVSSSRTTWVCEQAGSTPTCYPVLALNATIDGGKFELRGAIEHAPKEAKINTYDGFLALGDYKARLMPNKPKDPSVLWFVMKSYELLMTDGRLVQFQLTGQSE